MMSRWLRSLAVVAPQAALRRMSALQMLRSYDAAQSGFRTNTMARRGGGPNASLSTSLQTLTARAHDMVRNTPEASRTIDVLASHIVGTGVHVAWDTGSDRADAKVKELWERWCKVSDIEGVLDFAGLQRIAVASSFEGGETLVRMIDQKLPARDGQQDNVPSLRLQVLEGEQIDIASTIKSTSSARRIVLGVEVDEWNRRHAYHVRRWREGENAALLTQTTQSVPAADCCHLFRMQRPGQLRGVTLFAPVMLSARDHADLIEALTMKARMEACFGVGIETPERGATTLGSLADEKTTDGKRIEDVHPGMFVQTRPGEKIFTINPTGGLSSEPILLANLMRFASGVGITYDQLTGDLRQANYSSLRAGKIEFFRFVEQFQWLNLVPMVLERIVARWLDRALMANLLPERRDGYNYSYVMPAREPIDPKKDLEADILAVRSGRLSPQEFIAGWGRDWRKVIKDMSTFLAEIDRAGIVLDVDPRRTNQSGSSQPVQATIEP